MTIPLQVQSPVERPAERSAVRFLVSFSVLALALLTSRHPCRK